MQFLFTLVTCLYFLLAFGIIFSIALVNSIIFAYVASLDSNFCLVFHASICSQTAFKSLLILVMVCCLFGGLTVAGCLLTCVWSCKDWHLRTAKCWLVLLNVSANPTPRITIAKTKPLNTNHNNSLVNLGLVFIVIPTFSRVFAIENQTPFLRLGRLGKVNVG